MGCYRGVGQTMSLNEEIMFAYLFASKLVQVGDLKLTKLKQNARSSVGFFCFP